MLTFSFANIKLYAMILLLKINLGFSQSLNNTEILTIANDVRNLRFASAQDQILNNPESNPEMVAAIIQNVYSNTENNTKIILDFAQNVTAVGLRFYIRRALQIEMAANNHSDPIKLISLYRAYEDDFFMRENPNSITSGQTPLSPVMKSIFDEIQANVKASAKQILKDALIANSFERNEYVRNVTSELFNFLRRTDDEVMRELANETYPLVSAVQLAENIMVGSRYIPQQITFLVALYEQLEINNDLNNEAVLKIAYFFRILKKLDTYRNLFTPKKYAVNEIIKRMPICARNLYFSYGLCIWNRGRSEYLYAASSQHNLSRRGIFTYGMHDITAGGIWIAEHFENVYLESFIFNKEYLYASTTDKYSPTMRHVVTWVDDGFVGDTCAWKVELDGDYCYLRNVNFNEYLYTSDRMHAEKKRYVFTTNTGAIFDQPDFQWQIRNCG